MKKIDPADNYYWQMNELDKWTHYALHEIENESLKTHGKNKRAATELVMKIILQKFKQLKKEKEEELDPHEELSIHHKNLLRAIAKIYNDFGFSFTDGDFDQIDPEDLTVYG